jgi:hypothetical protein
VVRHGVTGILNVDLAKAARDALALDPAACRAFAESRSWRRSTEQFVAHLAPAVPTSLAASSSDQPA